jgi:transcriptional regulator with XRE-family HTH domain
MPRKQALTVAIRRHEAVELVVAHCLSVPEAAEVLGIFVKTVRRYLQDNSLGEEIRAAHRSKLSALLDVSLDAAPQALATLRVIARDETAPDYARVTAVGAILEHSERLYATADLDERLEELERKVLEGEDP